MESFSANLVLGECCQVSKKGILNARKCLIGEVPKGRDARTDLKIYFFTALIQICILLC